MFHVLDVVLAAVDFVFFGHPQLVGSDVVESGVEVAHGHQQGVDGTAVLQVADQKNVQVLQCALCLVDGVEIRAWFVRDAGWRRLRHSQWARGDFTGIACGPFEVVAHHDDVGIVAHHLDGVFQRLALG